MKYRNTMMLEKFKCYGEVLRISLSRFQHQRTAYSLSPTTTISLISSTHQMIKRKTTPKCSCHRGLSIALICPILLVLSLLTPSRKKLKDLERKELKVESLNLKQKGTINIPHGKMICLNEQKTSRND